MEKNDRLARAKKYVRIAEAPDSAAEAFQLAAKEIVAYRAETGATFAAIGAALKKSDQWVAQLVKWHDAGFPTATPYAGEAENTRVAISHAKRVLREQPAEVVEQILADLPDEAVAKVEKVASEAQVKRVVYPDKPQPTHKTAARRAAADDAKRLQANPDEAVVRFLSLLGQLRATTRVVVQGYQDFLALVEDEERRELVREQLVASRVTVDLALGEVMDGGFEAAVSRLLNAEEVG